MTSWENITEKSGGHHQDPKDYPRNPKELTWISIRAIVKTTEHMDIDHKEKSRGTVSVQQTDPPAIVNFIIDIHDGFISEIGTGIIKHGQKDSRNNLCQQKD